MVRKREMRKLANKIITNADWHRARCKRSSLYGIQGSRVTVVTKTWYTKHDFINICK